MNHKIVIFQENLMHYRFGFFDQLQKKSQYDMTVLYSNPCNEPPLYPETMVKYDKISANKIGPFNYYSNFSSHPAILNADILVLPGDLRVINIFTLSFRRIFFDCPRIIFWGMDYGKSRIARPIRRMISLFADSIVFYSERRQKRFTKDKNKNSYFTAPNTMFVSNHGISSESQGYLLYVGRLQERKRLDLVLKALVILHEQKIYISLKIVGKGKEESNKLNIMIQDMNLRDHVSFEGAVYDDTRLKKLFSGAYAYISPGPVGLGAIHSIAYGVPVITARNANHGPEFDHLVEDKSVFLCELIPESIVGACLRVLNSDRATIREMAYQSFLEGCEMSQMVDGFHKACKFVI